MQGRHFLHIPGPSPIPDRILRAIAMPIIDHRSAEFAALGRHVLEGSKTVFQTKQPVVIYPSSGTGAWEAAIVNTLSPGDTVLMAETGHFATLWKQIATRFGIEVEFIPGDWRHAADPAAIEAKLAEDKARKIKAVMVVHNETSTGATSRIPEIRKAIDAAGHPALFMVDTISSLASVDYRHDEWQVDVTVSGSQKGLMLPPGLGFNAISEKALAASKTNTLPRSYWDWQEMVKINANGFFPYTPATNLLYGLKEALAMLQEEGLDNVFARHKCLAAACRAAVKAWGLEVLCQNPAEHSPVLTAVLMPPSHDADRFRKVALETYNISLGSGLGKVAGKVFRIGHLGECNELSLLGALSGIELGLSAAGVPHRSGGVAAAMASFEGRDHANETVAAAGA
ncbi:MAG: aminotransferase class V-fold PLP-dependent enzyme [Bosea sp.]|uniref:pyridoxal-phosphate-dependent aminotransferase family protein n=1 Tax=Bosea sp. (in: a-proteobacteria) TaxID=1871050 RepID=UPI001ACA1F0B|nr:aminotransferase class V-fold PLP-dependent enzyme [Bosea sp. (in: a-proteobacteria)]MBN9451253.1 aminotransferase class V-fold PLP-dependent enzyme [Bosea sp. (in: a-proteobacteria)]